MSDQTDPHNVYETLAAEYYNRSLHPTCANLREASGQLVGSWLQEYGRCGTICEIGCGMSIVAEPLLAMSLPLSGLYLTDSSSRMLEYSAKWVSDEGAHAYVADADSLPFVAGSFAVVVTCLGDPYNSKDLWSELSRVTSESGHIIFTTPSYEWSTRYRDSVRSDRSESEFLVAGGRTVAAPSIVLAEHEQREMIYATGSLTVADVRRIRYSQLSSLYVSPKLEIAKDDDLPVVTGYLVEKHF